MSTRAGKDEYVGLLRSRGIRRYIAGEAVSSVGNAIDEIALVLLAIEVAGSTGSGSVVGAAIAVYTAPGIVAAIAARSWVERLSGRALILIDAVWRGGLLLVVGVLAVTSQLRVGTLLALLGLASLTKALSPIGTRRLIVDVCRPDQYWPANHLLGSMSQMMTVIGPALASWIAYSWSAGAAVVVDAVSFLLLAALLAKPLIAQKGGVAPSQDGADGSASSHPVDRRRRRRSVSVGVALPWIITTFLFFCLYGPIVVTLPLMSLDRGWPGGESAIGLLWSGFGLGALLGAVYFARRPPPATLRTAAGIVLGWAITTLAIATSNQFQVALMAMLFGGFTFAPYGSVVSTALQRSLTPVQLSRVGVTYEAATGVATPAGVAAAGVAVAMVAPPTVLAATGIGLVVVAGGTFASAKGARRTVAGQRARTGGPGAG